MFSDRDRQIAELVRLGRNAVNDHILNLEGLTVYTEAATGSYSITPCLAAAAGADVIALARDSKWGAASQAADLVLCMGEVWRVAERIRIVYKKTPEDLFQADIITNSGHVRPLDAGTISALKPTAVIPMLWETFEWRPEELDLAACKKQGILVMGTDESRLNFFPYAAEVVVKFLHGAHIAVHKSRLLCLGSGPMMESTISCLQALGAMIDRASWREEPPGARFLSRHELNDTQFLEGLDAVICDERVDQRFLIGPNGLLNPERISMVNPGCIVINRHGLVEEEALLASELRCLPHAKNAAWQTPNMTTAVLGPRPVVELMTAGLGVGAVMARTRLSGASVKEAARYALANSYAQDLVPPYNWLRPEQRNV